MNTHQKILLIEKYRMVMNTLQADLLAYLTIKGLKKTDLMFFLREHIPATQEISNVAFYEKIKNAKRWKINEILLVLEYMNALDNKEIVSSFYQLINEEVKKDIDKSPFQFKFLTSFYDEHFDLTYSSFYYQPERWRFHLDELVELYRLIEHMEKFRLTATQGILNE